MFQTLVSNSSMAEKLIDSDINAVTFTGSNIVGAKVAQRATSQIKKCVLELGGSDPFIVCSDADVEKASTGAVKDGSSIVVRAALHQRDSLWSKTWQRNSLKNLYKR